MRRILVLTMFAVAAMTLVTIGASAPVAAEDVIKFGCAISLSGKLQRSGNLYKKAYDMTVDEINKTGGVTVGGKTYKMEIQYYDDESDATKSTRLFEKLVTVDRVNFLLGPYSSGITQAVSSIAEKYEIPMIEGGGASATIFSQGYKYIFGNLPVADEYFSPTLELLKKLNPEHKKLGLAYADDKFDLDVATGLRRMAGEQGFELVVDEKYESGATDFSSIMTKMKAAAPHAILVAGHEEESINFIHQAKEQDVNANMLCLTVGVTEPDFRKSLGEDAEAIFGVASWDKNMDFKGYVFSDNQTFVKLYQERYNEDPDYHVAAGVALVGVFKKAIETANTLDPKKVRDVIADISLDTIYGKVQYKPNGQIKGGTSTLQIQSGDIFQVYPNEDAKPIYPMPKWSER